MFAKKSRADKTASSLWAKIFRCLPWGVLGGIWLFIFFAIGNHWLVEVPAIRNLYKAGLEQGFDALAGIVAASDPAWEDVRQVSGLPSGGRFYHLHGDTMFNVWLEQDDLPTWHAGMASLRFDRLGQLEWARRYYTSSVPVIAINPNTGENFPVVKPRLDLRRAPERTQP